MSSQGNTSLRVVTWNTNGIRSPSEKFSKVLRSLSDLHADIVFIQETHAGPNSYQILADVEDWKVFFTVHSSSSKGVAILIKNSVPFEYICHDEDCSGGYIVLFCHLYGELYTLVNVYNHKDDRFFLVRLKEYLMETAEGVLVVGGDFNTVLDPSLDRKPSASRPSPFIDILEDFIVSLNVRDTWSYLYRTKEGFTRNQNESHSRIDMFFMRNDTMGRAHNITVEPNDISDHHPLVLELRAQQQTVSIIPNVALFLDEFGYDGEPDRSSGKISGAEILSAIQALADSEEQRPDQLPVRHYKRFQHPMSEILKINYNLMLKNKFVDEVFKNLLRNLSLSRHIFNVDYLIFSEILARRLNAFISLKTTYFCEAICAIVIFDRSPQNIRWSFLETIFERLNHCYNQGNSKQASFAPPPNFHILDCLLHKTQSSPQDLRDLQPGCPLTSAILNLALDQLDITLGNEIDCKTTFIYHHKQILLIYAQQSTEEQVVRIVENFQDVSGIRLSVR